MIREVFAPNALGITASSSPVRPALATGPTSPTPCALEEWDDGRELIR
jgi:hypothetical protein